MNDEEVKDNLNQLNAQLEGFDRLGRMIEYQDTTNYPDRLMERIEALAHREAEGVLSVEAERRIDIVLCTGGPHCEVQWFENDRMEAVCYGWFGAGEVRRPLGGDEEAGLRYALDLDNFDDRWDSIDR